MGRKIRMGILAASVALLLGVPGRSHGKPILQEDFRGAVAGLKGSGRVVATRDGFAYHGPGGSSLTKGSYVEYSLKDRGFNPKEGALELDLTRGEKETEEALVSFADETGRKLVTFIVYWEGANTYDPDHTCFSLNGDDADIWHVQTKSKDDFKIGILVPGAYVKGEISRGRTVHVAMTWGLKGVKIYVGGALLQVETVGLPQLQQVLAKARKLIIGAMISSKHPEGAEDMSASSIANVQLHDTQVAVAQLNQSIVSDVPSITAVSHDAFRAAGFSGKLVAGNKLNVSVNGTAGAAGSFDLVHYPNVDGKIPLDWKGWGVYLEDKTFYEENEVNLRDVNGYRVYAGTTQFDAITEQMIPVATLKAGEQSYTLEFLEVDKPYYAAVVAEMSDGTLKPVIWPVQNVALTETESGVYSGEYTVTYQDKFPRAVVVGRLAKGAAAATALDANALVVDPALNLAVATSPGELKADEKSTSQIQVAVTDANGNPVAGHKVKFLLATTSQYTGVVGGGAFAEQVGGTLQESTWGETDLFGRIAATYVAGFAAKTAVIVARDMASNSTGAGYIKTYIQAAAELELEPLTKVAAAEGYEITVTSSDSWLTADGKSQARITAKVTLGGNPVEGHKISFDVSSGTGSIRTVKDTTDKNGEARAVYTAGKKIGIVLVSATDTTVGISGSVQIELRSDAPAKIQIKIKPEKLPADGHSRADLHVLVTDINDNPNDNVEVEYAITSGSGRLREEKTLTDKNGESSVEYVAGKSPGRVTFELTVRSMVPTEEEMTKARNLSLAVPDYAFF